MHIAKKTVVVYGVLFSAMLIWGFSFLAIKDVISVVPIFTLLFIRFAMASIILGGVGVAKRSLGLSSRNLFTLVGLSLLSPIGYFLFETFGIAHTQPSHVSVIIAIIPTVVFLIALVRRQERTNWRKWIGIGLAYVGVLLIIGSSRQEAGASLLGDLLIFGAVLCAATRTVFLKEALKRITPLQATFYPFAFSLLLFGPLASTESRNWLALITPMLLLEMLFLGVLCSAAAFLAMHYALKHLSATQVAVSANFVPVVTVMAEMLVMGGQISLFKGVGTAAVIGGVLLARIGEHTLRTTVAGIEEG